MVSEFEFEALLMSYSHFPPNPLLEPTVPWAQRGRPVQGLYGENPSF